MSPSGNLHRVSSRRSAGWGLVAQLALALLFVSPALASHITIINNGPNSNRVNVVFLGDGYTASEINTTYPAHIVAMTNYMFNPPSVLNSEPYPTYKNYFNVHRINVVSNESGADVPPLGISRDTALDATYRLLDGIERART